MSLSSLAPPSALTSATDQSDYPATLPLALLAFHRHVGPIFKGTDAKYGKFADLRTVLDAVTPPLLEQGLVLTQTLTADPLGAGAVTLLRTQLLHAPSGQELSSDLALPTLDTLLARLHDLRLAALNGFPFDLQLAAAGGIPLVLPPKSPAPAAAAPEVNGNSVPGSLTHGAMPPGASHQRQPGLRLDDQIKGFYGLQQSLGTTSNPLHSIGGAVTYFRRYAILAILSLAAEDNDGADYGDNDERQSQPRSRSRNQVAGPQVAGPQVAGPQTASSSQASAPKPSPARNRRTVNTAAQSAGPQTAPEPGASEPVAPEPMAPELPAAAVVSGPVAPGAGAAAAVELSPTEIQGLINSIRALPNEQIPSLVNVFREQFQLPVAALVSDYIRTREHAAFIEQRIQQLTPVAV